MKQIIKRVILMLCMVTCLLSLAACTNQQANTIDEEMRVGLQELGKGQMETFASLPEEEFELYIKEFKKQGMDSMVSAMEGYQVTVKEEGVFQSLEQDNIAVAKTEDGYAITMNTVFGTRDVVVTLNVNEEVDELLSMSFNPVYTVAEKLAKAAMNTLMGMGTVFAVLIFISVLIGCFKYISVWENKGKGQEVKSVDVPKVVEETVGEEVLTEVLTDDLELVAAITAAIAAFENTSADGLVVRSIKRSPANKWKRA